MWSGLKSLSGGAQSLLVVGLGALLLAMPRLLASYVSLPRWWLGIAFFGPYFLHTYLGKDSRAEAAEERGEHAELVKELGLEYRYGRRRNRGPGGHWRYFEKLNGELNGWKIAGDLTGKPEFKITVDYGFSDRIRSRSIRSLGRGTNDEVLTGDPEFDERYRIEPGNPEFDENYQEFKKQFPQLASSDHPAPVGTLQEWLTPTRRATLNALGEVFVVEDLQWNTLEVEMRTELTTAQELREVLELLVLTATGLERATLKPVAPPQDELRSHTVHPEPQDGTQEQPPAAA